MHVIPYNQVKNDNIIDEQLVILNTLQYNNYQ